ncbi:MAG: xanthine dehydrogenase family protein subunit M [Desulfurococcales archaeon]|jgi:carbon-monoxide dehydrogenase medium subunit|uniref:Xanthine dehydrogenase family protein subunit M n=1 Tax=Fervidicoccus fontis TaxID=683846 RepID=A0A7J3SMF6_9CREN
MSAPYTTLPEFKYVKPTSLEEAIRLLKENEGNAKIMNGGIGLIGFMKERLLEAELVVDIKGIKELKKIEYLPGKGLLVGATVTGTEMIEFFEKNPDLREKFRAFYEAASHMADAILRNRASIVGNILEGLPYVDMPGPAVLFDAEVHAVGPNGEKWIPVDGLVLGPAMTKLEPYEIVTEILYKEPPEGSRSAYVKLQSRSEYGIVNISVLVANPNSFANREVRVVVTSATQLPFRARSLEQHLKQPGKIEDLLDEGVEKMVNELDVIEDPYATAEFRKYLIKILTIKTIKSLLSR